VPPPPIVVLFPAALTSPDSPKADDLQPHSDATIATRPVTSGEKAMQGRSRETLANGRRQIDRSNEHVRNSLERVASGESRMLDSLVRIAFVRIAWLSSRTFRIRI
jgi:hypothetical protein